MINLQQPVWPSRCSAELCLYRWLTLPAMLIELSVFTISILYSLALLDVNTNAWMAFNMRYSEAEKHKCDICYGEGKFGFPVLFF